MASRNGQSVFDIITNGWRRKVLGLDGGNVIGVSVPADFARDNGIEPGQDVVITKAESQERPVLELHFEKRGE